jgi:hypothetical protein
MAKYPTFQNSPQSVQGPGPGFGGSVVRKYGQQMIGQGLQDLGEGFKRLGRAKTAEGKIEQQKAEAIRQLSEKTTLVTNASKLWFEYAKELQKNPDAASYEPSYNEFEQKINETSEGIEDPKVKAEYEAWLGESTNKWRAVVATESWDRSKVDLNDTLKFAHSTALEQGDASLVIDPVNKLFEMGLLSEPARDQYIAETEKQILKNNEIDYVWETKIPNEGYEAALEYLNDPAKIKASVLEPKEILALADQVKSQYNLEKALTSQKQAAALAQNHASIIADAHQGKITAQAMNQIWEQVRMGQVDATVASQVENIITKPRDVSDYEFYHMAQNLIQDVVNHDETPSDALVWLTQHAGEFKQAEYEGFRDDLYALRDNNYKVVLDSPQNKNWVDPIRTAMKQQLNDQDPFSAKWNKVYADMTITEQRMRSWVMANPDATFEERAKFFQGVAEPLEKPGAVRNLLQSIGLMGLLSQDYLRTLPISPDVTPTNEQQFELTLQNVERTRGKDAAVEYYNQHIETFGGKKVATPDEYVPRTQDLEALRNKRIEAQAEADKSHGGRTKY